MKFAAKTALVMIASLAVGAVASAEQLSIEASKTIPLRLDGSAASIVVGNKNIADVAVHDDRLIFITGKSYGTTNLLVFNKAGDQIYGGDIVVTANSANLVSVNRAGLTRTYDCAPVCRSTMSVGDDPSYFNNLISQQLRTQALTEGGSN